MSKHMKKVHVLFGVTNRDHNELVCQFFETRRDLLDFWHELPGNYQTMVLEGIDYDQFEVLNS